MYTRGIVTWHSWNWRNVLHLYTAVALTLGEPQKHLEDLLKQTARPRPQRSWPSGSQRGLGSWHLFPRWRCCCWLGELSTPAEVMPRCAANSPSRLRHSECRCWPLSVSPETALARYKGAASPRLTTPCVGPHIGRPVTQGSCVGEIASRRQRSSCMRKRVRTWGLDVPGTGRTLGEQPVLQQSAVSCRFQVSPWQNPNSLKSKVTAWQ